MHSTMMDDSLNLNQILRRAETLHSDVSITSRKPSGELHEYRYGDMAKRARQLSRALIAAGIKPGDRVATLMWNHYAHLEAYFGIPAAGGVLHTLNLRLHADDIGWIAKHAEDRFLIVDNVLLPLLNDFKDQIDFEKIIVFHFDDTQPLSDEYQSYENLLNSAPETVDYPAVKETDACGMCYTSGTTGRPKGVVYSQRSSVLHAMGFALPDAGNLSMRDSVMPVVPMFHAMAWGLPYAATMVGAKQALPGMQLDALNLLDLADRCDVSFAAGVPTIWMRVAEELEQDASRWSLRSGLRLFVGGSATPTALIRRLDQFDIDLQAVWGMTETSPIGSVSQLRPELDNSDDETRYSHRAKAGLPLPLVDIRHVNDEGEILPWDGKSVGELQCRGPWITGAYYLRDDTGSDFTDDGWFVTGDVVTIGANGYISITDRAKDLIKSGGEWISSVELENALMGIEGVAEAAVISIPHPKWMERPLALVVTADGATLAKQDLAKEIESRFAKWWLPEDYVFIEEIPKTSTGKFMKRALREQYADYCQ